MKMKQEEKVIQLKTNKMKISSQACNIELKCQVIYSRKGPQALKLQEIKQFDTGYTCLKFTVTVVPELKFNNPNVAYLHQNPSCLPLLPHSDLLKF